MKGVSVVIPSFERPILLDRLLKSIENQTFKNIEVIVVDDCSKNVAEVEAVVQSYAPRIKIELMKNSERRGAPYSRNQGIRKAQHNLIALVDDDDEWLPEKIQKQVELFSQRNEQLGIVYTWTKVIDSSKTLLREAKEEIRGSAKKEILDSCFISSPSVMVRKQAIVDAGLFDESFPSCQDWEMWTRMIFKNYDVDVCPEFLTLYYKHDGPTIGTSPRAKLGFLLYYQKHLFNLIRYGKARHLIRWFRLQTGI